MQTNAKNRRFIAIFVQKLWPFKDYSFSRLLYKKTSNLLPFIKQIFPFQPYKPYLIGQNVYKMFVLDGPHLNILTCGLEKV